MRKLRAIAAASIVVAASVAGTLYIGHVRGSDVALASDPNDESLIDTAFARVEQFYYQPVDPQQLFNGERSALQATLTHFKVSPATLPAIHATGDEAHDIGQLRGELELAVARIEKTPGAHADPSEVTQAGVRGMLAELHDPYTVYLTKREISALEESLKGGDFGGIGVYIVEDAKTKDVLVDPIEGTPAAKAGIKPGDVIVSVNGESVHGLKLDDIERAIRGKIGTVVVLVVRSHGATASHAVSIVRDRIYVPSVHSKFENGFEYVRLSDFGQTSYDEVRKALLEGKQHHAQGYILDLRDNGGGLLDAAVQISSLFIPQGTIVTQIDRAGTRRSDSATHESIGAAPLVVLVNKYTASASEITAGAIQDYHAGTIIGTRSFGKGVVQSIYDTDDGGALKITTARYVTPKGRSINHRGIEPDIIVDQPADAVALIDTPKDTQLVAAKDYLRRLARR
ncbi:MAG: S41 family peptidase [Vulcanimicrobiaceae bacterium]